MVNFFLNAMYGAIYGWVWELHGSFFNADSFFRYTPEVMPDRLRGLGCGLTLACGRVASLSSPFIATFGDVYSSVPIYVCCGLFVAIGFISLLLPFEPQDMANLDRTEGLS